MRSRHAAATFQPWAPETLPSPNFNQREPIAQEALDFILFLKSRKSGANAGAVDAMGYPAGYFESTFGSFANEPLERPAQPPLDPVPS